MNNMTAEQVQWYAENRYLNASNNPKLNITFEEYNKLESKLVLRKKEDIENPHIFLTRYICDIDNIYFTSKNLFGYTLSPLQCLFIKEAWKRPFSMLIGTRGFSKSFILAVYAIYKALIMPGSKIILTGAGFRQSKQLFKYCEAIWNNGHVLRDLVGKSNAAGYENGPTRSPDAWTFTLNESEIIAIPIGDGERIRGLRSTCTIVDEFKSIRRDVFEEVIRGFGVVSQNPIEAMKQAYKKIAMLELGLIKPGENPSEFEKKGNQLILSGTAYYKNNHIYNYFKKYKDIIFSNKEESFNKSITVKPKDIVIFRIPYDLVPKGIMEEDQLGMAKETNTDATFKTEYGAVFVGDSDGFFRRSKIESCVTNPPIEVDGEIIQFCAQLQGQQDKRYVFGVDPAAERDNFAIVILEVNPNHRKLVYCWTSNQHRFEALSRAGHTKHKRFYDFVCSKIKELMSYFPCSGIAIDSQGGGNQIIKMLGSPTEGEGEAIYEIVNPDAPQNTDYLPGKHLIEKVQFRKASYTNEANHLLKHAFESRTLLLPFYDNIAIALAQQEDESSGNIVDTLEGLLEEIEALKDELTTIVHTLTPTGIDHWDTPSNVSGKSRYKKDRYSALLMANHLALKITKGNIVPEFIPGADIRFVDKMEKQELTYNGPAWFTEKMNDFIRHVGVIGN